MGDASDAGRFKQLPRLLQLRTPGNDSIRNDPSSEQSTGLENNEILTHMILTLPVLSKLVILNGTMHLNMKYKSRVANV